MSLYRIKLCVVVLAALITTGLSFDKATASQRIVDYDIPNEFELVVSKGGTAKYLGMIKDAKITGVAIQDRFKKKVSGKLLLNGDVLGVKLRITGDWKDHLASDGLSSSLAVDMSEGNIGGVVKFRLLFPETKRGSNEILWSVLMEQLGYPVPYRKFVNVTFLGQKQQFIFEERPAKEFLESFGFRETVITEFDERQIWSLRQHRGTSKELSRDFFHRQYILDNSNYAKNFTAVKIFLRAQNYDTQTTKTFDSINTLYAKHGLIVHNRKFIYDPTYNYMIPIYFDGNVNPAGCDLKQSHDLSKAQTKKFRSIEADFTHRTSLKMTEKQECMVKHVLSLGLAMPDLKTFEPKPINHVFSDAQLRLLAPEGLNHSSPTLKIDGNEEQATYCQDISESNQSRTCEEASLKLLKSVITGNNKPKIYSGYRYYDALQFEMNPERNYEFLDLNLNAKNQEIDVAEDTTFIIEAKLDNAEVTINLNGDNSKVIFVKSDFKNSTIATEYASSLVGNKPLVFESRYDTSLNTACMAIWDSVIDQSRFTSNYCALEDAINFVRTKGNLVDLEISNAAADALDSDFSTIDFSSSIMRDIGNDCFDVSSGNYRIRNAQLSNCGDKGISVGERSLAAISNVEISSALIGVASKDLSVTYVSDLTVKDTELCLNAYGKKQEHGGGSIFHSQLSDSCSSSDADNLSKIEEGPFCKFVGRNKWFEYCLSDGFLNIDIPRSLPKGARFFLHEGAPFKSRDSVLQSRFMTCESFPCHISLNLSELTPTKKIDRFGLFQSGGGRYVEVTPR